MGSGESDHQAMEDEKPSQEGYLDAYFIGMFSVTAAQFRVLPNELGPIPRQR